MTEIDWLGDRTMAQRLAKRVAYYWQSRGHNGVRTWIEVVPGFPGDWQVRSNIKFVVPAQDE